MKCIGLSLLLALLAVDVCAESVPAAGRFDARVKHVVYNDDDVVKVMGHYGYSTDIVFADEEDIAAGAIAIGDQDAWDVAPVGNHLFVKPHAKDAVTNMTVVTHRRIYQFALDARESRPSGAQSIAMYFQVRFVYPDDEAAAVKAAKDKAQREHEATLRQALLDAPPLPRNFNYYACGDRDLWPSEVFDDGRFTYLRFPAAQEIPAIFLMQSDRSESLANGGMHDDQYVVQTTGRKFVLRKGNAVACVENRSFDAQGVGTPTGIVKPGLERSLRATAPTSEQFPPPPRVPATPDSPSHPANSPGAAPAGPVTEPEGMRP